MNPENNEIAGLKTLVLENQRLLAENNELLKKMHRSTVRGFWLNVAYILVFLGLPVIIYYYFMAPYMQTIESVMPQTGNLKELKSLLEGSAFKGIEQR